MPQITKTSFAGGELSPTLLGRVDLDKYKSGTATMRNFFVDYRGPASTRPGTKFVGNTPLVANDPPPRLIPFVFSTDQAYVLELNDNKMRVIANGAYVTEAARTVVGGVNGNPLELEVPGHGYVPGDFVIPSSIVGLVRPNGISGVNGRAMRVMSVSGDFIRLGDYGFGIYLPIVATTWSAYSAGGSVARIYSVTTPWNGSVLFDLNFAQSADVLTVVHPNFPIYDIERLGLTNWQITQVTFGASIVPPGVLTATPINQQPSAPVFQYNYAITSIDANGRESNASIHFGCLNSSLDQVNAVVNRLQWNIIAGAVAYRVYKVFPVPDGTQTSGPYTFGVVATVYETAFVDVNYSPDFSVSPPQSRNPLQDSGVVSATITAPGTGYVAPFLEITDATGSGAQVLLTSDLSLTAAPYGKLNGTQIVIDGTNYTAPVGTVRDAAPLGSGLTLAFSGAWIADSVSGFKPAVGSITIADGGGNYHKNAYTALITGLAGSNVVGKQLSVNVTSVVNGIVTAITWSITGPAGTGLSTTGTGDTIAFTTAGTDTAASGATVALTAGTRASVRTVSYLDQRKVYAGSDGAPSTFWMSRIGQYNSFDTSDPPQDDDAITGTLAANEVNIITSLTPVTSGLIALTSGGAYLITGGTDSVVTPTQVQAKPQVFSGASPLEPLRVGNNVLYAQARGSAIRDMQFNIYTNNFTGQDISVMSAHLLAGRRIVQWTYAEEPFKLVWAVRDDGVLLSLTYLKEQEVYGWARHDTAGKFVSVCSIPEGREDAVYAVVYRYTPAHGFLYSTERFASRDFGANTALGIPANPELAWCVDAGAAYPLTYPAATVNSMSVEANGQIANPVIVTGGSDYPDAPIVQVVDDAGSGTGATLTATAVAGELTTLTVATAGQNYVKPRLIVLGGSGAAVSVALQNPKTLTLSAAAFSGADVGKVVRMRGGRGVVISVPSASELRVDWSVLPIGIPNLISNLVIPPIPPGEWSLTAPVQTIGGLEHLNGLSVQILADGSVQTPKQVVDGCITLDTPATAILAGAGFTALLQTVRFDFQAPDAATVQTDRKLLSSVGIRKTEARGLQIGAAWSALVEVKDRPDTTGMGSPTPFETSSGPIAKPYPTSPMAEAPYSYPDDLVNIPALWSEDGVLCIAQMQPLPATIIGLTLDADAGDR